MRFDSGLGNMSKMMKQAKKVQEQIAKLQEELRQREVEASSGGGAVSVKVTGKQEITAIKINPEAIDLDDIEMLEDLILAAVNEGIKNSQEMASDEMAKITGGLNIPGL